MEIECVGDPVCEIIAKGLEEEKNFQPTLQQSQNRYVDTISFLYTQTKLEDRNVSLKWTDSAWCPWNWGDQICKFENWCNAPH